jgi:hypothetical protein
MRLLSLSPWLPYIFHQIYSRWFHEACKSSVYLVQQSRPFVYNKINVTTHKHKARDKPLSFAYVLGIEI